MFVKSVPADHRPVTVYDAGRGPVDLGVEVSDDPPNERNFVEELKLLSGYYLHVDEMDEEPSGHEISDDGKTGKAFWTYKYARWWDNDEGVTQAVATTDAIYLMSDQGKTIDKV